jgi:hypothetical protein
VTTARYAVATAMPTPRSSYRLDPDLKRRVAERAQAEGITPSEWVKRCLETGLKSNLKLVASAKPAKKVVAKKAAPPPTRFRGPFPK